MDPEIRNRLDIAALAAAIVLAALSGILELQSRSEPAKKAPWIEVQERAKDSVCAHYYPHCEPPSAEQNARDPEHDETGNQTSNVNDIFGMKRGEALLVLFTFLLWVATQMLVRDAKKASKRQLRAYVFVESGSLYDSSTLAPFDPARKSFPVANFLIKNSGQTPAYQCVSWAQLAVIRPDQEDTLIPPSKLKKISPLTLGANGNFPKIVSLNPDRALTPQEIVDVQSGVKAIFAFGRLEYLDTFDALRWTNFRLSYTGVFPPPKNMVFNFSVGGNDAK